MTNRDLAELIFQATVKGDPLALSGLADFLGEQGHPGAEQVRREVPFTFDRSLISKDWYRDGIDCSEDLWRLDFYHPAYPQGSLQAQLFMGCWWDTDTYNHEPSRYHSPRLFLERDARDETGEATTDYACLVWPLTPTRARQLLQSDQTVAASLLEWEARQVLWMPPDELLLEARRRAHQGQ